MLCSRFLRPPHTSHSRLYRVSERFFDGMLHVYDVTLTWVLRHRRTTMVALLLTFVVTAYLFAIIPKGFIPNEDNGTMFAFTETAQDISFDAMVEKQRAVAAVVRQDPSVQQLMSFIGASGSSTVLNNGRMFALLKPRDERPHAEKVIEGLRPKLATVPGIRVYPQILPTIRIGGQLTKAVYQYSLQDPDTQALYYWAPIIYDKLRQLPELQDVNTDLQLSSPQVTVEIDRNKASALDVTVDQIESALGAAYGSKQVSTIYTPSNQYWVILEVDPQFQRDPSSLGTTVRPLGQGRPGAARLAGHHHTRPGAPHGDPPGSAACRHHLLQHETRRVAQRRGCSGRPRAARAAGAGHGERDLSGHRAGVPGLARRARASCCW